MAKSKTKKTAVKKSTAKTAVKTAVKSTDKTAAKKKPSLYKAWSKEHTKDSVISLRINGQDLNALQAKAAKKGIKYQTYIGDILTREAQKVK